jgi:predicted aspartyl protease
VSLRFPYKRFKVKDPIPSLAGQRERPRPILAVTLIGPAGSRSEDALLDTGADDTLFPEALATLLGIDLSQAPIRSGAGFGMHAATVRYAEVLLRIADTQEQREWKAQVGFTSAKLRQPLLGNAGVLQFFTATFHGDREEVELTINPTYPGR